MEEKIRNSLENFGDRLNYVLNELGLTQAYIAENAGITQGAVSQWLSKDKLSRSIKKKLIFLNIDHNVNLNWLQSGLGVPLLGSRKFASYQPEDVFAGESEDYYTAKEVEEEDWAFVKKVVQENQHVKIFRVVGDSMAPTLWDTDIVFCYPHVDGEQIRDTHIYVIHSRRHGSYLIKRIQAREDGTIKVYSDNRTEAKSFVLNLENDVLSLWRVRTKMTWQLGAPTYSVNQFDQIEKRLSKIENSIK